MLRPKMFSVHAKQSNFNTMTGACVGTSLIISALPQFENRILITQDTKIQKKSQLDITPKWHWLSMLLV